MTTREARPGVDIIVPVYRDLDATRRCVESVIANTGGDRHRIILVDDASPEPELSAWCAQLAESGAVQLLRNAENRGFVASVNRGMETGPDRDVVLLNSDTEVPPGWLERLQQGAYQQDRVATVTPFSNNATICSYPLFCQSSELPAGMDLAQLDALFAQANAGQGCEIPTCVGFCVYIRRAALDELGPFDEATFGRGYGEENDFSRRAVARGWSNRLCADLFVYHQGGVSFGDDSQALMTRGNTRLVERFPDYPDIIAGFVADDPLQSYRARVDQLRVDIPGQAAQVVGERRQEQERLQVAAREAHRQELQCRILGEEIARLREALGQFEQRCEDYEQRCAAYETHLVEAREQAARTDAALTRLQDDYRSLLVQRDQVAQELAAAHERLQQIYNSRVWRYTQWLRKESR